MTSRRAVRALSIAAWAGFFLYLWQSGEMTRYLGPRTYWVVVFGAVALTIAALGQLLFLRAARAESPASATEAGGLLILLLPILLITVIPRAELGSLAASRKGSGGLVASLGTLQPPTGSGEISFIDVVYAADSSEYALARGIAEGTPVELLGFVSRKGDNGSFDLTRFYISCCAADAIPYSVSVEPYPDAPEVEKDGWFEVAGTLVRRGEGFVLAAERVTAETAPDSPYLY